VRAGSCAVLLTADAESAATLPLGPRPAGVLQVAHHGSQDPALPQLLRVVRPGLAVVSVGSHNRYGHPHASTLAALRRAGVAVRRTDREGDVVVRCLPVQAPPGPAGTEPSDRTEKHTGG
jgi:competence protein ComEC